jgi:hypothetical protein
LALVLLVIALSLPLWSGLMARVLPRDVEVAIGDSLVYSLPSEGVVLMLIKQPSAPFSGAAVA